ncbi:hemerythrin domain-containing protein [Pacificibacter marinus]|uniref:Hemerythrin HHE cation binding domain protein n=1 Tax=Pacificibacter marinus TaxID=658057 RepID=A0A1Y5TH89_9RHOB|nr:hemerythrin domain-containing protein [Pacificibacter marinus]SEL19299.1 Hemerythrin HHE cation binding domain-containing protein [Pacificibacter marinus]SLN63977.1 Hemerythrin HHE cation binding domain protein [Pacificibacter marinus]
MKPSNTGPWDSVTGALSALDEAGRPMAPALEGGGAYARKNGRRLAVIHRMHLRDIVTARQLLEKIEHGGEGAAALVKAIPAMTMTKNYRTFGNLCGRECMVLNMHHNIEEQDMFPRLESGGNAGISAVVAKLREEHRVVHALIERLYEAAVTLVEGPAPNAYAEARSVFEQLEAVVKSHFKYEETELEEALGLFGAI